MVKLINNQNLGSRDEHFLFNPKTMPLVKDFLHGVSSALGLSDSLYVSKEQATHIANQVEESRTSPWDRQVSREDFIDMCRTKDKDAIEKAIDLHYQCDEDEEEEYCELVKEIVFKHFLDGKLVFKDG